MNNKLSLNKQSLVIAIGFLASTISSKAAYVTVDIGSVVNTNISINPASFPVGLSSGNTGTGIPFVTAAYPGAGGNMGAWIAPNWENFAATGSNASINLTSQNITGQASFYALLNNYFGTPGENEYNVTITATDGAFITYTSIGSADTRDYNQNVFTNSISATTTNWFDNGVGQRLDVRAFTLPASFASKQIQSFELTQVNNHDAAVFSGLTFSTEAANLPSVPDGGSTAALFGLALGGMAVLRRQQRPLDIE